MEGLEDSSTNGNHEELWTEQEYNDIHGFTCAVKLDADKNLFLVTIVLNDTKIEVLRSYNAFYELNDYLRTSIEFSSHVETLPELPSSEAAYANCMVLENWLEVVRVHMGEYLWNCRRLLCFLDDTMETPNLKDCQLSNLRRKMAELTVAYRMLSMKLYNNEGALNDMVERLMYIEAQQNSINHHHQQKLQQQQQDEDDQHYHHQQQQYLQQQHEQQPPQSNLETNHDHNSLSLVSGILGDILVSVEDKASVANATTSTATSASNGVNHVSNGDSDRKGVDVATHGCTSPVDGSTSADGVMNGKHHPDSVDKVSDLDTNGQGNGVEETGTAPIQPATESGEPPTAVIPPTTITTTPTFTETIIPAPVTAATTTTTITTTTTTGETDAAGMEGPDKGTEKAPDKASCLMNRALAALNSR